MKQGVELKRLGDEVGRPLFDGLDRVFDGAVAGNHDRDDFRVALERGFEDLPAVDAGQAQVRDEDVEGEPREPLEGEFPAAGLLDDEAVVRQPLGNGLTERAFVVNDQQMLLTFRHLVERAVF